MNLLCYLLGHDYDPEGECHGYYDCTRCGASGYAPQETPGARVRAWIAWRRWQIRWTIGWPVRWWWSRRVRCSDCGGLFGRHSDKCLPF